MKKAEELPDIKKIEKIIKEINNDGIIRRLDGLGRVVIPVNFRRRNGYIEGIEVAINKIDDYVVIRKAKEGCYGIIRTLDELGRPVIPIEIRNALNWEDKDRITIILHKDIVILRKLYKKCIICYGEKQIVEFNEKMICEQCAKEITKQTIKKKYITDLKEISRRSEKKMLIEKDILINLEEKSEELKQICESKNTTITDIIAASHEIDQLIIEKINKKLM